ncbi:MAG: VWA-like domain-containing protein [Thermosynechococcaceae cyanobacterium]
MQESQKLISASLLRLRMKSPFFATLALFARFIPTQQTPFAATDGKDVFFNADYLRSLPTAQQDGLLLHEVLHAALMHVLRRGVREAEIWNIAADIVVNGVIAQQGVFELPPGGLRNAQLEHLSVEEVYELLLKEDEQGKQTLPNPDLLNQPPEDTPSIQQEGDGRPSISDPMSLQMGSASPQKEASSVSSTPTHPQAADSLQQSDGQSGQPTTLGNQTQSDSLSQARKASLEAHWQNALQQATVIARTTSQGKLPAGMDRELGLLTSPQLDWRAYLWRYLVQTPTDFMGFDRRFVGRGLYLEALVGESVQVFVAVDTSGSIDNDQLQMFLSEVQGILGAYPHLQCELYYADADAYGPFELNPGSPIPNPQGGGGTSFIPFFEKVDERWDRLTQAVCIYLTDGYGNFPEPSPELPTLWVVTPGGLDLPQFPFGEAIRLLSI